MDNALYEEIDRLKNTQAEVYANIRDKALEEAAKVIDHRIYTLECCDTMNDWHTAQGLKPIAAQIRALKRKP